MWWIRVLVLVSILTPMGNDIFIASLPEMVNLFPGSPMAWFISSYMVCMAIGQLFWGGIVDRYGSRACLFISLGVLSVGVSIILQADSFALLLVGRALQGVGAAASVTVALAIARHHYQGNVLTRLIGWIMGSIAFIQCVSPWIGGLLAHRWGWQAGFFVILIAALFFIVCTCFYRPIYRSEPSTPGWPHRNMLVLLRDSALWSPLWRAALSYGLLFSYLSSIAFVGKSLHLDTAEIGFITAINALALATMAFVIPVKPEYPWHWLGSVLCIVGSILLCVNWLISANIITVCISNFIVFIGIGIHRTSCSVEVMAKAPAQLSGSAAALYNVVCFSGGACCALVAFYLVNLDILYLWYWFLFLSSAMWIGQRFFQNSFVSLMSNK